MEMDKLELLKKISNPAEVMRKAKDYLGSGVIIHISTQKNKKYMVMNPQTNKYVHFGSFNPPLSDFTYHKDNIRRNAYLKRAKNIKGNWRNDKYSPNNLSIHLLW